MNHSIRDTNRKDATSFHLSIGLMLRAGAVVRGNVIYSTKKKPLCCMAAEMNVQSHISNKQGHPGFIKMHYYLFTALSLTVQ